MQQIVPLIFPKADLTLTKKDDQLFVNCVIRKKAIVLTPEEWVRQHVLHYLTNHNEPIFIKHGVIHYCVPNIASRVARTASFALSNIFSPLILEMGDKGGATELIKTHPGFRNGVYIYRGILTNEVLGKVFNLNYKDINLILPGM